MITRTTASQWQSIAAYRPQGEPQGELPDNKPLEMTEGFKTSVVCPCPQIQLEKLEKTNVDYEQHAHSCRKY